MHGHIVEVYLQHFKLVITSTHFSMKRFIKIAHKNGLNSSYNWNFSIGLWQFSCKQQQQNTLKWWWYLAVWNPHKVSHSFLHTNPSGQLIQIYVLETGFRLGTYKNGTHKNPIMPVYCVEDGYFLTSSRNLGNNTYFSVWIVWSSSNLQDGIQKKERPN